MKEIIDIQEHYLEQGSPEWFIERLAKLTGSTFGKVMPSDTDIKKGVLDKFTKGQLTILLKVAGEALTGESSENDFKSAPMIWGDENEPFARDALSKYLGKSVSECGFFTRSDLPMCGSSPDGMVGDMEAMAEIKCPNSSTHLSYYLDNDSLWKEYRWQITGHCLFSGLSHGYLCSFDPRMPLDKRLVVCEPPEGFEQDIETLRVRLVACCELIKGWIL